ncbi:MFS transporter [Zavarzinia compransoris]|uniref:MFS transporter n=1 Tax=Zavarzinia marina TaxID=2911065 RepID=UPI001F38E773|nr:MFS transporter [Zavarzinia marina]MCF4164370.1 MFS transporter [Zavarzinia marina]
MTRISSPSADEMPRGLARIGGAFRHRAYRLFFSGQAISLTGTWVQMVALSWLVYRLTGSALMLGTVVFVNQLPIFLLSPLAGALADRVAKRRLVIMTQAAQMVLAALLAVLTLSDAVTVPAILVLSALVGIAQAIDIPTRQAFVVEMVGKPDLPNAIALNSSLFNAARLIGPSIGGLVVAAVGEGWCFAINAVSFGAVIASLALMPVTGAPSPASGGRGLAAIVGGFAYVRAEKRAFRLLALAGWASLVGMPYTTLLPIYADLHHGGGPDTLGLLMGAAGAGAFLGAAGLAILGRAPGIRAAAVAAIAFGAALSLFALAGSLPLALGALAVAGFSMMTLVGSVNIGLQLMVPDELRGRVMALFSMMFLGMAPFGGLLVGAAAEGIGVVAATVIGGGLSALAGVVILLTMKARGAVL